VRAPARSHAIACPANATGICTPNHGRTPWEIGHPDLPRQRERPRVAKPGGVLFPAFAKEAHAAQEFGKTGQWKIGFQQAIFALKHPGAAMLRARGRGAAATGACAPRGDASTRAARGWVCNALGARRPQGLPVGDSRQYGTSIEHATAVRLAMPSGARGLAVAYAEAWEKVFREDGSSEAEQRRKPSATGSNPVRPPLDSSDG
jgi:hypothetical protein